MTLPFQLAVLDMAGTTVRDNHEVLECLRQACLACGIEAGDTRLIALMGVSKLEVFNTLWREQLGPGAPEDTVRDKADHAFVRFREILETYYRTQPVEPMSGAEDFFAFLHAHGVKIALNTGFYREVADIILQRLGWDKGLNAQYTGGPDAVIDFSISSDEVPAGRPAPYMIHRAMKVLGVEDPKLVIKIGDTPVDLLEGQNAGVGLNLGVCNGTHSRAELTIYENDGLYENLDAIKAMFSTKYFNLQSVEH